MPDSPQLRDFLLAMIAEDKTRIHALHASPAIPHGVVVTTHFRRNLADCEAKRQILEAERLRAEQGAERGGEVFGYHATGLRIAMRYLAVPYADHPDYRQEWRP